MNNSYFLQLFLLSALFSCADSESLLSPASPSRSTNRTDASAAHKPTAAEEVLPGVNNLPKAPVVKTQNNNFQCSYGGFLFDFGSSFSHPTTIQSYQTGTLYIPSILAISASPNPLLQFRMGPDGSSFTAVFSTFVGVLPVNAYASLTAYYDKFDNFITQVTDPNTGLPKQPTLPDFVSTAANFGYNPGIDGLLTVKGKFILDHTSNITNVSIIDIGYLPTPIPAD